MKKMKWMMAIAFGLLSMTAFAQTEAAPTKEKQKTAQHHRKDHSKKWQENVKDYEAKLQLTPEQLRQWQALQEDSKAKLKALKGNTALSQEEKKSQMQALRQQKKAELEKILSAEQFAKYKELRKQNRQERKANGHKKGDRKRNR